MNTYNQDRIKKYYCESPKEGFYNNDVLEYLAILIDELCEPYDKSIKWGGRGDSRIWRLTEKLTPEFTESINWICYFHDQLANLVKIKYGGVNKHLTDMIFYQLLKGEQFMFAWLYYQAVDKFGGSYEE